jgi:hypothetical protein
MWELKVEGAMAVMAIPQAINDGIAGSSDCPAKHHIHVTVHSL